jgi:membrane associated rhomboid family serine protease
VRDTYGSRPSFGFGPSLSPTIRFLLAANISVFVLQMMLGGDAFERFFGLVPDKVLGSLHIWQLVTYMFLHSGISHIFWNMLILWMFGSEISTLWGRRAFLQYYLTTGIGAGLVYVLLMPLLDPRSADAPLIGASGACFGILTAYGLLFPERRVLLWFLIPIKVKVLVVGVGLMELLAIWNADNIGHLAHLGGILFGVLYLRGGRAWVDGLFRARRKSRAGKRFHVVDDPPRDGGGDRVKQSDVDDILEKISREGLGSLTPREQEILRRASKH